MPIEGYQNFTYQGYTNAGGIPTLYFAEGHYTQTHPDLDNIGWHPLETDETCVRKNINQAGVQKVESSKGDRNILSSVMNGPYEDNTTGILCEFFLKGNIIVTYHLSRGRFQNDGVYDEQYARNILAHGKPAPNEEEQNDTSCCSIQ